MAQGSKHVTALEILHSGTLEYAAGTPSLEQANGQHIKAQCPENHGI